jgi:hypothetical protein
MDTDKCNKSACPIFGRFCWKNPTHWVLAFAVLPFTVKGLALVSNWVHGAISSVSGS